MISGSAVINLGGQVKPSEFGYVWMSPLVRFNGCKINYDSSNKFSDQYIQSVINYIVKENLDGLKVLEEQTLNTPKENRRVLMNGRGSVYYARIKIEYRYFRNLYLNVLAVGVSDSMLKKIHQYISNIDNTILMRDSQLANKKAI